MTLPGDYAQQADGADRHPCPRGTRAALGAAADRPAVRRNDDRGDSLVMGALNKPVRPTASTSLHEYRPRPVLRYIGQPFGERT